MEIFEKVSNIIKDKFNSELVYSKEDLKAEKKNTHTKGGFQCLYAPIILIDENYYSTVFLEKYYFIEVHRNLLS